MSKKSGLLLAGALATSIGALSTVPIGNVIHRHEIEKQVGEGLDENAKVVEKTRRELKNCIRYPYQTEAGASSFVDNRNVEYDTSFYQSGVQLVKIPGGMAEPSRPVKTYVCPTSLGYVYYGYQIFKDDYSCRNDGKMFVAMPLADVSDQNIEVKKASVFAPARPKLGTKLFHFMHAGDGWAKSPLDVTGLLQDGKKGEKIFVPLLIAGTEEKLAGEQAGWHQFIQQILEEKEQEDDKETVENELQSTHGDVEKLFKGYVDKMVLEKYIDATDNDVKKLEKIKPLFHKRLVRFYRYVEKNIQPNQKVAFLKALYRLLKCNAVVTKVVNIPDADFGGLHFPGSRNLAVNMDQFAWQSHADHWFHEFIHALTLEKLATGIPDYDTSARRMFLEGTAVISAKIANPAAVPISGNLAVQEYADFGLLTAAFLGKEGLTESMIVEDGLLFNIKEKYDERVQKFMEKWKIKTAYKNDLMRAFGSGDPYNGLDTIKIPEAKKKNRWTFAAERLYVLREILKQNGIPWFRFIMDTNKEFQVPYFWNSLQFGHP